MGTRSVWNTAAALIVGLSFVLPREAEATIVELTARPATGETVNWGQFGTPNLSLTSPQSFTSTGVTTGKVSGTGSLQLVEQCCIGLTGTFDGDFAPGAIVLVSPGALTINFNTPVQSVGTQIQNDSIGSHFIGEILAFNGSQLLGAFIASGFSGDVADNSNIFLGVQDTTADITSVTYLTFANGSSSSGPVAINELTLAAGVPEIPTLPLFAIGLGALGLLSCLRKQRTGLSLS